MAKSVEYRGFVIANPRGGLSNWQCTFTDNSPGLASALWMS